MKLRRLLRLIALLISARTGPLPVELFGAAPPAQPLASAQISVQLDWIRLPHVTANQLVRQRLRHSREANDLYAAVQELITQKKAERINLTALLVQSGQQAKNESVIEKPYPTEFNPGDVAGKINAAGEKTAGPMIPASPLAFTARNLGVTAYVEATLLENGRIVDLNIAPEWVEHLTDVAWGEGANEIKQPVFGTMKLATQVITDSGAWQLAGLFTPPSKAADKPPGAFPLSPDRVLLFVRATAPAVPGARAVPREGLPHQVMVFSEWIETDASIASALLAKYSAFTDSPGLRDDMEPMLTDGRAALLQTAAVVVRGGQRSKIESITEFPYPTVMDPPRGGFFPVKDRPGQDPQNLPAASTGMTTVTHGHFTFRNTGTTMEVEATIGEGGDVIDLNLSPEIIFNAGVLPFGKGDSRVMQPRFQTLKHSVQILLRPNISSMAGSFDMPRTDGKNFPTVRTRKVLLFVRAIH